MWTLIAHLLQCCIHDIDLIEASSRVHQSLGCSKCRRQGGHNATNNTDCHLNSCSNVIKTAQHIGTSAPGMLLEQCSVYSIFHINLKTTGATSARLMNPWSDEVTPQASRWQCSTNVIMWIRHEQYHKHPPQAPDLHSHELFAYRYYRNSISCTGRTCPDMYLSGPANPEAK